MRLAKSKSFLREHNTHQKLSHIRKNIYPSRSWLLLSVIFLFTILFLPCLSIKVQGATYKTIWWLGHSPTASEDDASGIVLIYYTYPERVEAGEQFNVGVTLVNRKDEAVVSNWLAFTNVSVSLRNFSPPYDYAVAPKVDNNAIVIRPGERYSHSFSLIAPDYPGKYLVFPKWLAWFGPGTTVLQNFDWDMESYYNHTEREFGIVYPEDLPPITVYKHRIGQDDRLVIEVDDPYGQIKPIKVKVSNKSYDRTYNIINGRASIDELSNDSLYNVTMSKEIDMVPGKIRAAFVGWSDGQDSNRREVTLNQDVEIFALYKTQYYLSVESSESNTYGSGWYDSGSQAHYAVNPSTGLWNSFDRWVGDISSETDDIPSGHLTMDGPKYIKAFWKLDITYFGIIIGVIGGVATMLEAFVKKGKIRGYIHNITKKRRRTQN